MTRVDFHTNVGDKLEYACRLARKAYLADQPLVVIADAAALRRFDERLWTFSPLDFVPHCTAGDAAAANTPVVLAERADDAPPYGILMNLAGAVPDRFARFERLLEVVGNEPDDVSAARERYRFYRDRGYPLTMFKRGE